MSYAAIASQNIPAGEMPQPDQNLADGHFQGEHEAHKDADHKINILPAGTDPSHPDIHPSTHVSAPPPVTIHHAPIPEPHVSEAAPKPTPAPHKHDVHIPESGAKYEQEHAKAEKKAKEAEKKVEKTAEDVKESAEETVEKTKEVAGEAAEKTKEVAGQAAEKTKEVAGEAAEKAEEVAEKTKEVAGEAAEKTKEVAGNVAEKTKKVAGDVAEKSKQVAGDVEKKTKEVAKDVEKKSKEVAKQAKAELNEAERRLGPYWEKTKDVVLRPGTLGGLMGVANVGLLGTLGYFAYTRKDQPWDRRVVSSAIIGTLALFGAEGYVAESYLNTPEGQQEAERAKREGSRAYLQAKEIILRPGVFGGLAGAINVAVLGTVGYFSYKHWNQPWDRQIVSQVTIGLIALSGLEGWAGKKYKDEELPKRK